MKKNKSTKRKCKFNNKNNSMNKKFGIENSQKLPKPIKIDELTMNPLMNEKLNFLENIIEPSLINANLFLNTTNSEQGINKLRELFMQKRETNSNNYNDNFCFLIIKSPFYTDSIVILHFSMLQDPNYQSDGEFTFDSAINLDLIEVKKNEMGYYLEKENFQTEMRFYDGNSLVHYLENNFHEI